MSVYDLLLLLHVAGAFAMIGATAAEWAFFPALRRAGRPSAAAAVFRAVLPFVALVQLGALATVVFGMALTLHLDGYSLLDGWVVGSLLLWGAVVALGARTGRTLGPARALARDLAAAGDEPSPDLVRILRAPALVWLQAARTVALVAILALMVWKPGAA